MSFVNRQLYKQKPSAWGPVSSVQASIFKNVEKIGIDKNSLISLIPLWEKAGTVIHDYSKLNIDGSFTPNSSYWKDNSIYFNNNSGYCAVSIPSGLTNLSILFGTATATATTGRYLTCGTSYGNWSIWGSTDGIRFVKISHSTRGIIIPVADFLSFNHYNIAITHKSTPAQTFYVDGEQVLTDTTSLSYSTIWFFGGTSSSFGGINGYIDQFMLFNTVLTAAQIAYLSDNPYFLLHRVPPVFYSVPSSSVGLYEASTSWLINATIERDSQWRVNSDSSLISKWRVFEESGENTSWGIYNSIVYKEYTSWSIFNSLSNDSSWKVLKEENIETVWSVFISNIIQTQWSILSGEKISATTAWGVYNQLNLNTDWRLMALQNALTEWKIQTKEDFGVAWDVLAKADVELEYRISEQLQSYIRWRIGDTALESEGVLYGWDLNHDFLNDPLIYDEIQRRVDGSNISI